MIITVASNAQGVGKTLIATNIAVLRILAGHRVRLVDITPQKTSFKWCMERNASGTVPPVPAEPVKGKLLSGEFVAMSAGYNDVIIDTDWRNSRGNQAALELSDLVVVPLLPEDDAVENLKPMIRRIKTARRANPNLWALVVIVRVPDTLSLFQLDAIRRYIAKLPSTTLAGTVIHERGSLPAASGALLSIFEYKPADARAIAEMHDLYRAQKMRHSTLPSLSRLQRCGTS